MTTLKIIFFLSLVSFKAVGQTCSYKNLSTDYNFTISLKAENEDLIQVSVQVISKRNREKIQLLTLVTDGLYIDSFSDCTNSKSYSTKVNSGLPTGDENDSGNFIVSDFNFDGLEDFALKRDTGGNGGPLYAYYIQTDDRKFYKSTYLTDIVAFFPIEINASKKTLTTFLHANAYQKNRRIFKYNPKVKKWKIIYDEFE